MEETTYNLQARELRSFSGNHRTRFKFIPFLDVPLSPGGVDKELTPPPFLKIFQNWNLINFFSEYYLSDKG